MKDNITNVIILIYEGQELMKPELERDPIWRTIPCAKEILVQKGIANRAPWEMIQVIIFSYQ